MRIRSQKRILMLMSLVLLAASPVVVVWAIQSPLMLSGLPADSIIKQSERSASGNDLPALSEFQSLWNKGLSQY